MYSHLRILSVVALMTVLMNVCALAASAAPPAEVRSQVIRVALIVDGSASTSMQKRNAFAAQNSILDELKKAAIDDVLGTLRQVHAANEAEVEIKIVLFGEVPGTFEESTLGATRRTLRSESKVVSWIVTTDYRSASATNIAEMTDLIQSLKAAKATPLFDSISLAITADDVARTKDHRSLVIALTDGVDNTNHLGRVRLEKLKSEIRKRETPVHVLELDNAAYYTDNNMVAQYHRAKEEMEETDSELGDKFKYFQTNQLGKFRNAVKEFLPRIER